MKIPQLMKKYDLEQQIKPNVFNCIFAPCATQKTTWVFDYILRNNHLQCILGDENIIYVSDTLMLKDSVKEKYFNLKESNGEEVKSGKYGKYMDRQIIFKTYASLADELEKSSDFPFFKILILDECHNLANYQQYFERVGVDNGVDFNFDPDGCYTR